MHQPLTAAGTVEAQPARTRDRGEIISVFSLKGGVGTTTIAVNLAVAVKKWTPSSHVSLIDLSLEEALDSLLLDVMPSSTVVDWVQEDTAEATPAALSQYFIQHSSGVSLLAGPVSPEQAEIIKPSAVRRTLELAPQAFDYIVVDTPATFTEMTLITLELSSRIVLPVTADMASLKCAVSTLRILKALGISQQRVAVVVNEIVPRAGLTKEQLESGLGLETKLIPHGGPAFIEAANHGVPLVDFNPRLPSAHALVELASTLCEPERQALDHEVPAASANLLRRFRTR
jgi:pilus assembly protein CpaE